MTQQETQHGKLSDATAFRTVAPLFFLLLFAVIVSVQIYKAPFVGLANNGDFPKITGALSIGPSGPPERLAYFNGDYVYAKRFYWNVHLLLSELLPAWLAT